MSLSAVSGTAGSVLASRLSEDSATSVLVIEAGGSNVAPDDDVIDVPFFVGQATKTNFDWNYTTTPQAGFDNRSIPYPRGHVLGGSSSIILNTTITLKREFPFNVDMNSGSPLGVGYLQSTIGHGSRSSAATAFLMPILSQRSNLDVLINTHAIKVIQSGWNGSTPVFRQVQLSQRGLAANFTVNASKEILIAAGSIGTPQLLMLSGIGNGEDLNKLGIETVLDIPDVGRHMFDHPFVALQWSVDSNNTYDVLNEFPELLLAATAEYNKAHRGPLANNPGANNIGFFRLSDTAEALAERNDPATGNYFTILAAMVAPESRGSLKLASQDPFAQPLINPNMLTQDIDLQILIEAVKAAQRFSQAIAWKGYIKAPYVDSANLTSDDAIRMYIRKFASSFNHVAGTARVSKANERGGVVGPDLKVKGSEGLRIIDASVLIWYIAPVEQMLLSEKETFDTFTPPPNIGLTLPEVYDFHLMHSPRHPVFKFTSETNNTTSLTWSSVGNAARRGSSLVRQHATLRGRKAEVGCSVAILANSAAIHHLLRATKTTRIYLSEDYAIHNLVSAMESEFSIDDIDKVTIPGFEVWFEPGRNNTESDYLQACRLDDPALILHSSGTTKFPKAIYISHRILIQRGYVTTDSNLELCNHIVSLHSVPMFHAFGLTYISRLAMMGLTAAVSPPMRSPKPVTTKDVIAALCADRCTMMACVPSILEELSSEVANLVILQKLHAIIVSSGPLSADAGERLISAGVRLSLYYSSTEIGCATTFISDQRELKDWQYVRFMSKFGAHLIPQDEHNVFELVALDVPDHRIAFVNTTVDGKNAYRTGDLFKKHPSDPLLWKVWGRVDNQIVLSNGEKMVLVAHPKRPFVLTPKGTIQRNRTLSDYETEIQESYIKFSNSSTIVTSNSGASLANVTKAIVEEVMGHIVVPELDLFQQGCDSLQATKIQNNLRHEFMQRYPSRSKYFPRDVLYEHPSLTSLTKFIAGVELNTAQEPVVVSEVETMVAWVASITSQIKRPIYDTRKPRRLKNAVLITGTTGTLGCHLLCNLLTRPHISHIYAVNRLHAEGGTTLIQRQAKAIEENGLHTSVLSDRRVTFIELDITDETWNIDKNLYEERLFYWSEATHRVFLDEYGTATFDWTKGKQFAENSVADPHSAAGLGYSESKWVAEHVLESMSRLTSLKTTIIRAGQLSGADNGRWKLTEWFPTLDVSWLPVSTASRLVMDILDTSEPLRHFHLANPCRTPFDDLIYSIALSLDVPVVPYDEWLSKLRSLSLQSDSVAEQSIPPDPRLFSLLGYFDAGNSLGGERWQDAHVEVTRMMAHSPEMSRMQLRPLGPQDTQRWLAYWRSIQFL
ncbi:hypothetical protein H0H92_006107 [Tricholoma furcatifolium]|nr:hypothetical protein H0H92_006107 [Tricholoma furcatifolium]